MKILLLAIIVLISIASFYNVVPSSDLVTIYGILAIAPIAFVLLRKNLIYGLFLWFVFSLFKRSWRVAIPVLPDLPPQRIMWIALMSIIFLDLAFNKRKLVTGNIKIESIMAVFCIYVLFSGIFAGSLYSGGGLIIAPLLNAYLIPFSIYFLAKNIIDDDQKIKKTFMFFTVIGLYLGVTGIFEHFRLDFLIYPQYIADKYQGIHWGQARGPFVQAGVNGQVLSFLFFMPFYLIFHEKNKRIKYFLFISLVCILSGLLFTFNRGSWIAFIFASIWSLFFFPQARKAFFIGSLVLALVSITLFTFNQLSFQDTEETVILVDEKTSIADLDTEDALRHRFIAKGSIYARFTILKASLKMIAEKPFLGFGFFTFKENVMDYYERIEGVPFNIGGGAVAAHNQLLNVWVELGVIGLILYLSLFFSMLNMSKKLYHLIPKEEFTGRGLVVITVGGFIIYFISLFVREIHYMSFANAMLFLMFGILSGLYTRLQLKNTRKQEILE